MMPYGFILFIERWILIPAIGYSITHGWFTEQDKDWLIPVVDNLLGTVFVIVAYFVSHRKQDGQAIIIPSMLGFWDSVKGYAKTVFIKQPVQKEFTANSANAVVEEPQR